MSKISMHTSVIVPFYDLDPMNIVWHGNYLKYIEVARCDFFKKLNYTYTDMYDDNVAFPIVKMELKFIKSASFGQELDIRCDLIEVEPALIFKYTITDKKNGDKICTAKSMQMGIDVHTKESIITIPERMKKRLRNYNA